MPRYAGQLTFMIARLVKVFDEWEKKNHIIFLCIFLSLIPFPYLVGRSYVIF